MKRRILAIIALSIILLNSCGMKEIDDDIISPTFDSNFNIHLAVNVENETNYDNITIALDKKTYDKHDKKIQIKISDENVGKGFYIYSKPLIQVYHNDVWKNVKYNFSEVSQWLFIGEEGNTNLPNYTYLFINIEDIENINYNEKYRIFIFTKEKTIHSDFNFE